MNWKSLISPRWQKEPMPRQKVRQYSIWLGIVGLLKLLSSLGGAFMLTYWFLLPEFFSSFWLQFFLSFGLLTLIVFVFLRQRANYHYRKLLTELQAAQTVQDFPDEKLTFSNRLFYGHWRFLKISLLLYGLSFVSSYFAYNLLYKKTLPKSSPKEQAAVVALKQEQQFARDTTDLGRLEWVITHQQQKLQRQKNQLKEAQQSVRKQWGALANARALLVSVEQSLKNMSDSNQVAVTAQTIRANAKLLAQVKGLLEVQYELKEEKPVQSVEQMLQNDVKVVKIAQDLRAKYQRDLNRAQKGIKEDQKRIANLETEIKRTQRLCDTLIEQRTAELESLRLKKVQQEGFRKEWKLKE